MMERARTIGIVGDGQLGRMIVEDGLRYDPSLKFYTLGTAGLDSPAAQVGATQIEGGLTDAAAITKLVERSDITTWEIEHINATVLDELSREDYNIQPLPRTLLTIQDKQAQKEYLQSRGIDVAPFMTLNSPEDLAKVKKEFNNEVIVKARRGGYDGRSNLVLKPGHTWLDIMGVFKHSDTDALYAERVIPFRRELALVGARDWLGNIFTYPVVETIHVDNICNTVIYDPEANIPKGAEEIGRATIKAFEGAGVFAVEMFEDYDGNVLVNEVAPRVHNSGHWTDLGAETSQFEQHVRAIIGAPLGSTKPLGPTVMVNILGTRAGKFEDYMRTTEEFEHLDSHIRWYGKAPRPDGSPRKIGHITARAATVELALKRANALLQLRTA